MLRSRTRWWLTFSRSDSKHTEMVIEMAHGVRGMIAHLTNFPSPDSSSSNDATNAAYTSAASSSALRFFAAFWSRSCCTFDLVSGILKPDMALSKFFSPFGGLTKARGLVQSMLPEPAQPGSTMRRRLQDVIRAARCESETLAAPVTGTSHVRTISNGGVPRLPPRRADDASHADFDVAIRAMSADASSAPGPRLAAAYSPLCSPVCASPTGSVPGPGPPSPVLQTVSESAFALRRPHTADDLRCAPCLVSLPFCALVDFVVHCCQTASRCGDAARSVDAQAL
jgi:hypothetical protein